MFNITMERKRNSMLRDFYATYKLQNGHDQCEICGSKLLKNLKGEYICNYHHVLPFNEAGALGPDHYLNLLGICSNCHDKVHAKIAGEQRQELYKLISDNSCFKFSVFDRIKTMYKRGYLFNASLEYAVAMGMITTSQKFEIVNDRG